ncbi:phosphatidylinositol 3,4,5-trisphosphate 3-phosphatase and protein-tyrosine-phosphatase PTEN2A [Tanacetum coccineum]
MSQELEAHCKKEIQELLEKKLIRSSKSPWSCSAFYVMNQAEIERGAPRNIFTREYLIDDDSFPQRHVARESPEMLLGKTPISQQSSSDLSQSASLRIEPSVMASKSDLSSQPLPEVSDVKTSTSTATEQINSSASDLSSHPTTKVNNIKPHTSTVTEHVNISAVDSSSAKPTPIVSSSNEVIIYPKLQHQHQTVYRIEGLYGNNMEEVIKFFETYHKDRYKVYNLCSERLYDTSLFAGKVERDILEDDPKNPDVIAVVVAASGQDISTCSYLVVAGCVSKAAP